TVTGVAPGTKLYAVKVLNSRATGTLSQILCGIDWVKANAVALGIKVANMSIEGSGSNDGNCGNTNNDAEHKSICNATAAGVISDKSGGGTSTYYGTSQAAPHVAGTVALCVGSAGTAGPCSGLTPAQVISKIRGDAAAAATSTNGFTGDPLHVVTGKYFGYID